MPPSSPKSWVGRISRRQATAADREFLERVYASTREMEMSVVPWTDDEKDAFLRSQFHAQDTFYHQEFPDTEYSILLIDETPVGRLYVERRSDEIRLHDIALLPAYRGLGIGTHLLAELLREADQSFKPLRLHVEDYNPARKLYLRLGFQVMHSDPVYTEMQWVPEKQC